MKPTSKDLVTLNDDVCFTALKNVFVGPMGGIFDCNNQYPLLLHKSGLFYTKIKKIPKPRKIYEYSHLINLSLRANDFFSHVFSVVSNI